MDNLSTNRQTDRQTDKEKIEVAKKIKRAREWVRGES